MKRGINVPSPLFRDPIYDGATDPVVVWNKEERCWWMFYTQRRSSCITIGVSNIHGTKIGIACSKDGNKWLYRGTIPNLDFEPGHNTFWAPEVIFAEGEYHMYVSYITGIPVDWNYERHIIHYTSKDLWNWKYEQIIPLSSERVIDACVYEIGPHEYKMWYKDEDNQSHSYSAISQDLYNWKVLGEEVTDCAHEGTNVFELNGIKWMITDFWNGLAVYQSEDFTNWKRQDSNLLDLPGIRQEDTTIGHHADVVVYNNHAYIFYFVHPEFSKELCDNKTSVTTYRESRTCIQAAELKIKNGFLHCDRNEEFQFIWNE